MTAGDHTLGNQDVTGGHVSEQGDNTDVDETFSIASLR